MPPTTSASGPEFAYKEKLAQGRFELQKCLACAKHVFYPRVLCPHCGADRLAWVEASGAGVVYSTTVVRRKPEAGGDYNVALIDLAEGPRMMSRVAELAPADVKIGLKVRARVATEKDGPIVEFTAEKP